MKTTDIFAGASAAAPAASEASRPINSAGIRGGFYHLALLVLAGAGSRSKAKAARTQSEGRAKPERSGSEAEAKVERSAPEAGAKPRPSAASPCALSSAWVAPAVRRRRTRAAHQGLVLDIFNLNTAAAVSRHG